MIIQITDIFGLPSFKKITVLTVDINIMPYLDNLKLCTTKTH